jgi:hypothetical protein
MLSFIAFEKHQPTERLVCDLGKYDTNKGIDFIWGLDFCLLNVVKILNHYAWCRYIA